MNKKTLLGMGATALIAVSLTACGGSAESSNSSSPSASETAASASTSSSASASSSSSEATTPGAYKVASWALPVTNTGDKLGSFKGDSFSVDIYQTATDVASKDGMFVDPDTKENLLKKGAPIVYLNYVVTNTSSADIPLSHSLITPSAKYTDWKCMGGMPSDSSSDGFEKHGLTSSGIKLKEKDPFVLKPGESFNVAENFAYAAGKEAKIEATMNPQGADGKLDHAKKETAETTVTVK